MPRLRPVTFRSSLGEALHERKASDDFSSLVRFVRCYGVKVKPEFPGSRVTGTVQAEVMGAANAITKPTMILAVRRDIKNPFVWETLFPMPDVWQLTASVARR